MTASEDLFRSREEYVGRREKLAAELVRADVAPPQRLKARLIVCGIQGIAEAMPSHESRLFSSLLDYFSASRRTYAGRLNLWL